MTEEGSSKATDRGRGRGRGKGVHSVMGPLVEWMPVGYPLVEWMPVGYVVLSYYLPPALGWRVAP